MAKSMIQIASQLVRAQQQTMQAASRLLLAFSIHRHLKLMNSSSHTLLSSLHKPSW
jgi:hypothetical protein